MSQVINVKSTVAQAEGFSVEVHDSVLLSTRYFKGGDSENFMGKEVLFDFEDSDLEKGAFLTTTYKNGETVNWIANSVIPPRIAISDSVDPKGLDRVMFERLCRAQGADLNRDDAYQSLLDLKAVRLAKRTDRSIEVLAAMVLKYGKIEFDQPHDNSEDAEDDHICVKYYNPEKGCDNHYIPAKNWGSGGYQPYEDVCNMVNEMIKRGKRPTDVIVGASAWSLLSKNPDFKAFAGNTFHSEGMKIDFGELDGAHHVATAVFNGMQLNVIVYSGAYKAADGTLKTFIDPDAVIVISEGCGRCLQGGCTLLNPNSIGYGLENSFVDLTGRHCQSVYKDFDNQKIYIREESRPLPAPKHSINEFDWIYCDTKTGLNSSNYAVGVVYKGVVFEHVDKDGEKVTPTTPASCTAQTVLGGGSVTITAAATSDKTYKYFASVEGEKGAELTLSGTTLSGIPLDGDRDDDKVVIIVEEQ